MSNLRSAEGGGEGGVQHTHGREDSSVVRRRTHDQKVPGSSPGRVGGIIFLSG